MKLTDLTLHELTNGVEFSSNFLSSTLWNIQRCHPEATEQGWEVARVNLMTFNKVKCKVLHMGGSNHWDQYRLVDEGIESIPTKKNLGLLVDRSSTWLSSVHSKPRRSTLFWAAPKEAWSADSGRGFCPSSPLWWDPTWSPPSSSGVPSTRKTWSCWSKCRGGRQKWSDGWNTSPMRDRQRQLGLFSLEKRKLQGDLMMAFQSLKEA